MLWPPAGASRNRPNIRRNRVWSSRTCRPGMSVPSSASSTGASTWKTAMAASVAFRSGPGGPDTLVVGHPYVDIWQAVKPQRLGPGGLARHAATRRVEARRVPRSRFAARRPGRHRSGVAAHPFPGPRLERSGTRADKQGRRTHRLRDGTGPLTRLGATTVPAGPSATENSSTVVSAITLSTASRGSIHVQHPGGDRSGAAG